MIAPIFKLSTGEKWRPQPVETVEEFGTYDGTGDPSLDGKPVKLADLPADGGRMNFPGSMTDPTETEVVGYHRVHKAWGLWWHQFWLWYLYNPWSPFPGTEVGYHEGDWEFVQLGCSDEAGDDPVLATASQHSTGQKREIWNCELEDDRPVIYVARGSHANFFTPGDRGRDEADGKGTKLDDIKWQKFNSNWEGWLGRWGNSRYILEKGMSPGSPACQGDRWHAPHLYYSGSAG